MSNIKLHKFFSQLKIAERMKKLRNADGRINPLVHVVFVILFVVCGVAYLLEVNATSTKGLEIRALEKKIDRLEKVQKELEMRQVDASSLNVLTAKAKDMQLVQVDSIETLDSTGPFALNR